MDRSRRKIGFWGMIVLWHIVSWKLTLTVKLVSHFIFYEWWFCILNFFLSLNRLAHWVDHREVSRICHLACSLSLCLVLGGDWKQAVAGKCHPRSRCLHSPGLCRWPWEHVPMVHVQWFLAHAFNGFVMLGYKNTLWASQPENNATIYSVLLVMTGL